MNDILKKLDDENEAQYLFRIGQKKDLGLIAETWTELEAILNRELGYPEEEWKSECSYRKKYANYREAYEQIFSKNSAIDELYQAKRQYEDQRREYNKVLTQEARFNHIADKLAESVNKMANEKPLDFVNYYEYGENEAIIVFSDWHYGLNTNNIWNTYNVDICRDRVTRFVNKVKFYLQRHQVNTAHILLLGDLAHGAIHVTTRVASDEVVCDQLMHVSEIVAESINEISQYVGCVNVYATYGNHLRTIQNKHESIHSDNMEKIIPWWVEQRLQNNDRVHVIKNEYYEFIFLNVCGYNIVASHGDLERFKQFGTTVNTLFNKKYNVSIDYTISADKHHIEEFEQLGIESVLVRSLCGSDEHSNNNRLYSAPGQTLMIFSKMMVENARII